ncbi:MAG: hypothetical protein HOV87_03405 [Catenulispora sp.]|nr:hypothetical protein [Catenulispora sp.]
MNPPLVTTPIVLVGSRFDSFITAGLGLSAAAFAEVVARGGYDGLPEPVQVHVGQGLDEAAVARAGEAVERRGLGDRLLLDPRDLPIPVEARVVHKHDPRNVLLADFEYCGPHTFEASLRLHNDNELLQDHQSGPHLQGMVLIEAARQMFLAICELEYLRPWSDQAFSFLLTQLDTRFNRPVFPLPLRMRLTAHRAETEDMNRMRFNVETRFVQCGQETATSTVAAAVRPLEPTRQIELRSAETAIAALEKARPLAG